MSIDPTPRDVIARAISTACGEYEDIPVGFEYWGMTDDVQAALTAAGWTIVQTHDHVSAKFLTKYLTDLARDLDGKVPGNQPHPASIWLRGCIGMVVCDAN